MRRLTHDMAVTKAALSDLKRKVDINQQQTTDEVGSLREDMLHYHKQTKEALAACQETMTKDRQTLLGTLHESVAMLKSEMEAMKAILVRSSSQRL